MSIQPINSLKLSFKGDLPKQPNKSNTNKQLNDSRQETSIQSNPIAANLNVKKPISYKKISDIKISGTDRKAQLYKLANGQKIVILPKNGPAVVKTYFNVGSMNEPDHLRGISHFIEHNLFNGSKDLEPGQFFEEVSELGAYTNAATGYDQTNYYIKSNLLTDEYLEKMIKLHSDQVQNPTFPEDQIVKERGPVTSEIGMYADNAANLGFNLTLKNLFDIESTSPDLIAGTVGNINDITRKDVVDYYNTWYTPDNSTTVITGDIDPDKAIQLAAKYFTKNTLTNKNNRKYEVLTPTEKPIRVDIKSPNTQEDIITMGFVGPQIGNTQDMIETEILSLLLNGYENAPLSKALEKHQLWADFGMEKVGNHPDDSKVILISTEAPEEKSELALKIIHQEIAKFAQTPPSEEDLDMVKEKLKMIIAQSTESSDVLNNVIGSAFLDNDLDYLEHYNAFIEAITPQDIMEAAQKYLDLNKTSISIVHPADSKDKNIIDNYVKTNNLNNKSVSFGSSCVESYNNFYSNIKQYKLKNNMEVTVNPTKSKLATYYVDLNAKQPINLSATELNVMEIMLNRGSQSKNTEEFHDITSKSNISLAFSVSNDGIMTYSKSPESKLSKSLDLSKEVIANPRFTQEDFEWAKQNVKDTLLGLSKDANDKLNKHMFPNIKMMQSIEEDLKDLETLTLDQVVNDYNNILSNVQGSAVLSAPVEKNPALFNQFATALSKDMPEMQKFSPWTNKTYIKNEKAQIFTDTEQRLQAQVIQGYKFKHTGNIEDEAKIVVMNTILGGTSTSRLFQDLRESQKLAYYVASKYSALGDTGIIKLNILTSTDDKGNPLSSPKNIQKSLDGFQKHIDILKTQPVTEAELEKTKLTIKNNILSSIETSGSQSANLLKGKQSYYGVDQSKELLEAIENVTVQDIMDAANYAFKDPAITSVLATEETLKANNFA